MKKRIKKAMIIAVSYIMGAVLMWSLASIDSKSLLPFVLLIASIIWFLLLAIANDWGESLDIRYKQNGE